MPDSSTLTEQLSTLGVHLPPWPEEPERDEPDNWIKRGQAYAEGVRLWRAQLLTEVAIKGTLDKQLDFVVQVRGLQSTWDHCVMHYLLGELQNASDYERIEAAVKLVATNSHTDAQRLGAALEIAGSGFLVCAVNAIKQRLEALQPNTDECLELLSLLASHLPPIVEPVCTKTNDASAIWLETVSLHLHATSMLVTASRAERGEQDQAEMRSQIQSLLEIALKSRKTVIPELEYLQLFMSEQLGKDWTWLEISGILDRLKENPANKQAEKQARRGIQRVLAQYFKKNKPHLSVTTYAELNANRDPDAALPDDAMEAFVASAKIVPDTPLVLIQNFREAINELQNTKFWIAWGNIRTGSTMAFNLMRILARSLTDSSLSAWHKDFSSTQKFFETIEESHSIMNGVLKIHRPDESVNQYLINGQAKAVITHRNMRDCCYSYWRMVNNRNSCFYIDNAPLSILESFIDSEIKAFQAKANQPGVLLIREELLRDETERAIKEISEHLGISIHPRSSYFLAQYLHPCRIAERVDSMRIRKNSTGHANTTFLHTDHVSVEGSINSCSQDVIQEVDRLVRHRLGSSLDEFYYILRQ
jgi:hypothetical protein